MFLSALPKEVQTSILKDCAQSEEFQQRFGHDPILDEYDAMKENSSMDFKDIQLLLGRKEIDFDGFLMKAITPAIWSFLWITSSPFIVRSSDPGEVDIDYFIYVLKNGIETLNAEEMLQNSFNYCEKIGLSYEKAVDIIFNSIQIAFRGLTMLPRTRSEF